MNFIETMLVVGWGWVENKSPKNVTKQVLKGEKHFKNNFENTKQLFSCLENTINNQIAL